MIRPAVFDIQLITDALVAQYPDRFPKDVIDHGCYRISSVSELDSTGSARITVWVTALDCGHEGRVSEVTA